MESPTKFWCFICKKEVNIIEKENEIICALCSSSFVEEIEESTEVNNSIEDPRNFVPVTNTNTNTSNNVINSNNNNLRRIMPHMSLQVITSSNGTLQTQTFNNQNLNFNNYSNFNIPFQNIISGVNTLFNFSPVLNINLNNFGQSPLLNLLNTNNNDQQLENILNFLMSNDSNRYGTPPASKKDVSELLREKITLENLEKFKEIECLICMDNFDVGHIVTKMKCSHLFHDDCIIDWLKLHNSCPVCRDEMATDDLDYENRKNESRRVLR